MIYVDLVMGLNFLVDFLLLLGANSLSGYPPGYGKAAAAAAVGGIYGGLCLMPDFSFLGGGLWPLIFLFLIAVIAFGLCRSSIRRGGLFLLLSLALGGIAMGINQRGAAALIASAAALCLLCILGFAGNASGRKCSEVKLVCGSKKTTVMALYDTGNLLSDPISGVPVLIVGAQIAKELLGLSREQLEAPMETMVHMPGLRLIPYRAVGQSAGMLLGKKLDEVRMDGRKVDCIVAFAPQKIGNEGYEALAGGMMR